MTLKKTSVSLGTMVAGLAVSTWGLAVNDMKNIASEWGEKDAGGNLVVLGTEGSWEDNPACTKEAVYDGNLATTFEPSAEANARGGSWAGFHSGSGVGGQPHTPVIPMRIRYYGRDILPGRVESCMFQGANSPDFSDAVTLYTAPAWHAGSWGDVTLPFDPQFRAYSYFRVIGSAAGGGTGPGQSCGSMGEVEFYGVTFLPSEGLPARPSPMVMDVLNGSFNLRFEMAADALSYVLQRRDATGGDGAWTDLPLNLKWGASGHVVYRDPDLVTFDRVYRLAAINGAGTSDWYTVEAPVRACAFGPVIGTDDWEAAGAHPASHAFDGRIETFYSGCAADGCWVGLDLGETARTLVAVRYLARQTSTSLIQNYEIQRLHGTIQTAAQADFSDAEDVCSLPAMGAYRLGLVRLDAPVQLKRYVRYRGDNGTYGDIGELELELDPDGPPLVSPQNLTVTRSDITNQYAVLRWSDDVRSPWSAARVQRARSENGPFEVLGDVVRGAATTFTDQSGAVGLTYYYRVVYIRDIEGEIVEGKPSDLASYRRYRRLDRSWDDLTQVASGLTVLSVGDPWSGRADLTVATWFDNDLSTFGDMGIATPGSTPGGSWSETGSAAIYGGLDFGEGVQAGIGFIRACTRQNQPNGVAWRNVSGTGIYASNNTNNWVADEQHLIGSIQGIGSDAWFETTVASSTMGRYVYLHKPGGNWRCALAEAEFYGWTLEDIADAVMPPDNLAMLFGVGNTIRVTWSEAVNAVRYRLERKIKDGPWVQMAGSLTACEYVDQGLTENGRYTYRVIAVGKKGDEAVSPTVSKSWYVPGNGTGLQALYRRMADTNWYDSVVAASWEVLDPVIDSSVFRESGRWGDGPLVANEPDSADYVFATWNGKLIVPVEGDYQFSVIVGIGSDNVALLRIDGRQVANVTIADAIPYYADSIHLTAGEHAIRIDFREQTGSAALGLYWRGAVDEAGIPQTQLVPAPLEPLPEPWAGEWSYGPVRRLGWTKFTDEANFQISGVGNDFWKGDAFGHFVWRKQKGDFDCTFGYRTVGSCEAYKKLMVVSRNSTAKDSPLFAGVLLPRGGQNLSTAKCQTSTTDGIADLRGWSGAGGQNWTTGRMRLERKKNVFRFYFWDPRLDNGAGDWQIVQTFTDEAGEFSHEQLIGVQVLGGGTNKVDTDPIEIFDFNVKHEMPTMLILR